jgi:3-oxoacyl-[acyl-carrier protein] reductase
VDLGLAGKVALVGGGSRGLGRAAALGLAREGARVAIYARNRARLEAAAAEIGEACGCDVLAVACDVRDASACERIVAETVASLGGLHVLVTNMAGDAYASDVLAEPDDAWREEFELYTLSVIRLSRLATPAMRGSGGGSIVNITSCGMHQLIPELGLSEVVRLATTGFAKQLATRLAPERIRVNNVLPGWVEGELMDELLSADAQRAGMTEDELHAASVAAIPMGRFATNEEIADAIVFLASDRARYITGTSLRVDGGWCLGPTL